MSYICNKCSKTFKNSQSLNAHSKKHSEKLNVIESRELFSKMASERSKNIYNDNLNKYLTNPNLCKNCNIPIVTAPSKIISEIKSKKFCSRKCSGFWQSKHKKTGTKRSKLEKWLEIKLKELYPNLDIKFNWTDSIFSELDIYIPSLKLAFELNGIFHYEPIFGLEKLTKTQVNDRQKIIKCFEIGIELCVIDTTSLTYFKEDKAEKFLKIVANIISRRLASGEVLATSHKILEISSPLWNMTG